MTRNHRIFNFIIFIFFVGIMQVSLVEAQICINQIPKTTPTIHFTLNNNGTVTHNPTGLMWKVCSEGQAWQISTGSCSESALTYTWQEALQIPQSLNSQGGYAGHNDWRLPNIKELDSISEMSCYSPAINTAMFNAPSISMYWSASPYALNSSYAWAVNSGYGLVKAYDRSNYYHVRLVRNQQ